MSFRKSDDRAGRIDYEVAGLRWLAQAGPGSAPVVPVLDHGPGWLEEPELDRVAPDAEAARRFGRALAHTHAAGAPHLGAPPPGHHGRAWMGLAPLPLFEVPATTSWGEFYAHHRIEPYLDAPAFGPSDRRIISALCRRLADGVLDHDQPALVAANGGAARTHGDLWNGNLMWTREGVVLIDPAAQGGHAEEDLAALTVFGAPFTEEIWAGYEEVSPPADGWRERVSLHQMHMLMVHCQLFGGSYVPQTVGIARQWV